MAKGGKEIKSQISSVNNIKQITRAMQLMSVSKMRRSADRLEDARPYANRAREILEHLTVDSQLTHRLLDYNDAADDVLAVVVSSDKGLCGSFNAKVEKTLARFSTQESVDVLAVGQHAARAADRAGHDVVGRFADINEHVTLADTGGMFELLLGAFTDGEYNRVVVIYSHYESALSYTPLVRQLLPVDAAEMGEALESQVDSDPEMQTESMARYVFEPSEEAVLEAVLPRLTQVRLFSALLESQASEHAARMFAMKNATENAEERAEELEVSYNRARQAAVTQEISEIAAGANALS